MPKFSIIIPVYNVAPYLRDCLNSVREQTYSSWEAICVDDGSTDGSGAILDEYSALDKRFKVVHKDNAGVSEARNVALGVACGEWLYFLDADDVIVPCGFETLDQLTAEDRFDAYFLGLPQYFSSIPPKQIAGSGEILMSIEGPSTGRALLLTGKLWGWPWIRLLRRSLFGDVRFPVGLANLEDSISLIDVLAVKARWCWLDLRIYGYRHRSDSASRFITVKRLLDIIESFTRMYVETREKLSCSPEEALILLRQYSSHLDAYLSRAVSHASIQEIKQVEEAYVRHAQTVRFQTASHFMRLLLKSAVLLNCKWHIAPMLAARSFCLRACFYMRHRILLLRKKEGRTNSN